MQLCVLQFVFPNWWSWPCDGLCRIEKPRKRRSESTSSPVVCLILSRKVCIMFLMCLYQQILVMPLARYIMIKSTLSSCSSCCIIWGEWQAFICGRVSWFDYKMAWIIDCPGRSQQLNMLVYPRFVQQKLGGPSISDYEKLKAEKLDLQLKYNELLETHKETCRQVYI